MPDQLSMFASEPTYPDGFRYAPDVISREDERSIVEHVRALPFREFEFHGFTGKRRVVSFGWRYEFASESLRKADPMPSWLLPLRDRAGDFAGIAPDTLVHALVTEYAPGAAIGWHRDKDVFDKVIGISLGSPCPFRFRRAREDGGWDRITVTAEPRSVYLLTGESREVWEHSIPPVETLRYSITFRTFRASSIP